LLGYDEAVLLRDGKLSLNPAVCALDLWALHALGEQLEKRKGHPLDEAICARALRLYRGPLLDNESEDWMVGPRQQAQTEYLSLLRELGNRLEAEPRTDLAVSVYEKAIAVDPTAELPRMRLMLCLKDLRRTSEAIQIYEHYERAHNATRRTPSAEMRRIYDSMRLS
jgi:LuxR family transcriptional regulator, maltose regulon positive regulatory protein